MIISGATLKNVIIRDRISIVTQNLLVNLDPQTSIVGNQWLNTGSLGHDYDYTLHNNPTVTANDYGYTVINFAGGAAQTPGGMTNQYAFNSTGFTGTLDTASGFTLDIWCRPLNSTDSGCLIKEWGQGVNNEPTGGWEDSWICFVGDQIQVGFWTGNGVNSYTASSFVATQWYNIVMTYNGVDEIKTYVNGVLSQTLAGTRVYNYVTMFSIAACEWYNYQGTTNYFHGDVGPFKIYDRQLSEAEAVQNYTALKHRFGL